jgi:two-component system chemotaxis response regulator CheB
MASYPMPVVVVSSLTPENSANAMAALELGAVDVLCKPGSAFSTPDIAQKLVRAIRAASMAKMVKPPPPPQRRLGSPLGQLSSRTTPKVVAMGASTGGTQALEVVLRGLPVDTPGMVIVQHMPPVFTETFARRLDSICEMEVKEAKDGDAVVKGLALIAPGGAHTMVIRNGAFYQVRVKQGPPVHHQQPSVDVLFNSVAAAAGRHSVGVLMTGMGSDGAVGLLAMRQNGAYTITQDEKSCVVYGMPGEAMKLGAACEEASLEQIPQALIRALLAGEDVTQKGQADEG